ncbi:MAG: MMPL family transporter, partial [Actinobacteria bacterium]|nr:MMPL family transporter [Actinomycetota bacterium]
WWTVIIVLVVTAGFMVPASQLGVDSDAMKALRSDDPDMIAMERIEKDYGGQEQLTVVVDASKSDGETAKSFIEDLTEKLGEDERFKNIEYKVDVGFAGDKILLYLPAAQLETLKNPDATTEDIDRQVSSIKEMAGGNEYIVSEEGEIYLVNMRMNETVVSSEDRTSFFEDFKKMIEGTREEKGAYGELEAGYTGGLMALDYEGDQIIMRDFMYTGFITIGLLLVILYLAFHSLSIPLLSLVPLIISIIWTAGTAELLYGTLSPVSIIFAVLIFGIGVDYAIHLLTRFMQEFENNKDVAECFRKTISSTGHAIILGCLTTSAAFFALLMAELDAMKQLGVIGAIGFLATLVSVFILVPAIVTLRLKLGHFKAREGRFDILGSIGRFIPGYALLIIVVFALLSGWFGFSARNVGLNEDIYSLYPKGIPAYQQLEKVKEAFSDYTQDYLVTTTDSLQKLEKLVLEFRQNEEVISVESVLDVLPENQEAKLQILNEAAAMHPEFATAFADIGYMTYGELPLSYTEGFVIDKDGSPEFLIKIVPRGDIYNREYQQKLLGELREIEEGVTGNAVRWTRLIDSMTTNIIYVMILAVGIIFLIVYIGTRKLNPAYALISMVPVAFGVLALLGTYYYFGFELLFNNVILLPLIVGIGIDNGIYIMHRYLEEGPGSIPRVIKLTGKAIFLTTATTCLAFASLLFSTHPGMRSMGAIPVLGLIYCFIGALVFMPAIMKVTIDRKSGPRGESVSRLSSLSAHEGQ